MDHQIDLVIEHQSVGVSLDEIYHFGQSLVYQAGIVADADNPQRGALPFIKAIYLSNRDIESASDPIFEALDNPPLTFEGAVAGEMQLDTAGSDSHGQHSSTFNVRCSKFQIVPNVER